ncbi:MAG: hypothetical protein H0T89_19395 [Deltaproteobacteria bacterium]|nr:hypothetical protein [Deltaproteobacteria bacterium]
MHPRPTAASTIATTPRSELQVQTIAALEGFTYEMCACTDTACADAVAATLTAWADRQHHDDGVDQGDAAAADRIAELSGAYGECKAKLALPPTPPPRTLAAVPERAPDECLRYQRAVEAYVTCARVPENQRDVIFLAYQDQASTWDTFDFARAKPTALTRIASECKKARDATPPCR